MSKKQFFIIECREKEPEKDFEPLEGFFTKNQADVRCRQYNEAWHLMAEFRVVRYVPE